MHDWYGFAIGIGILFVILPILVGGGLGFLIYRRKFGKSGANLQGIIGGAFIGAAIGAALAVFLLGY
jgi:hypothetical protein